MLQPTGGFESATHCGFARSNEGTREGAMVKRCVGATIDINKIMGGIVSYVVDTLCMKRRRNWNYRRIHLSGVPEDACVLAERDSDCQFCKGGHNQSGDK